jgi:hypothetical protein
LEIEDKEVKKHEYLRSWKTLNDLKGDKKTRSRHSLGGRNASPYRHIPYHKGLGFIGISEWDNDDRFCHLTTYSKPYQISRYGGGMHLCTILFGLPFIFCYSHFQNQRTYSFGFLKIFKNGQFKVSSRFFDRFFDF